MTCSVSNDRPGIDSQVCLTRADTPEHHPVITETPGNDGRHL